MDSSLKRTYRRSIVQMDYFNSRKNVPKNVQKSVMQVLDCCFGYSTIAFWRSRCRRRRRILRSLLI